MIARERDAAIATCAGGVMVLLKVTLISPAMILVAIAVICISVSLSPGDTTKIEVETMTPDSLYSLLFSTPITYSSSNTFVSEGAPQFSGRGRSGTKFQKNYKENIDNNTKKC